MALPHACKSGGIGQLAVYGKLLLLHEADERLPGLSSGAACPLRNMGDAVMDICCHRNLSVGKGLLSSQKSSNSWKSNPRKNDDLDRQSRHAAVRQLQSIA